MGFLEDAGRGNAFAPINNVLGRAVELRQAENQENDRAYGRAIETEKMGMLQANEQREKTKFEWEEKTRKQKDLINKTPVSVSDIFGPGWQNDPSTKIQLDKMKELGLVNEPAPGVLITTRENANSLKEHAKNDYEFYTAVKDAKLLKTNSYLDKLDAAIGGDKDALKELGLKPEELAAKRKATSEQLSAMVESSKRVDLKFQKDKEIKTVVTRNADWSYVQDPDSSTGWSRYNSKTEDVVQHVAPPQSVVSGQNTDKRTASAERIARIRAANAGGPGGRKTALMQNAGFLKSLGWDEKEAVTLLTSTKPMSKDAFIGQATLKVMNNDMIQDSDRADRVKEAIVLYETAIAKSGAKATSPRTPGASKQLTPNMAAEYLSKAKGDKNKARELAKKDGWQF